MKDTVGAIERLIATESVEETYLEGGDFLPLSVWATRGFNVADIEAKVKPEDVKQHSVLGKVYRVQLISSTTKKTRALVKTTNISPAKRPRLSDQPRLAIEDGRLEDDDAEVDTSSKSSSSGSSSSSSSDKKKSKRKSKKHKKSKKSKTKKKDKKDKKGKKDRRTTNQPHARTRCLDWSSLAAQPSV